MSKKPGEWWDKSWSVVTGCTPAGEGCAHCWAAGLVKRFPAAHDGAVTEHPAPGVAVNEPAPFSTVVCHPSRLDIPLKRRKPTVFAVSLLGDLFHEAVPFSFTLEVAARAQVCPQHTFVFLTKRWRRAAKTVGCEAWRDGLRTRRQIDRLPADSPGNTILMASVWDQKSTDAACKTLSAVNGLRWGLHMEPLLGPVSFASYCHGHHDCPPACNCGHSHTCGGHCWLGYGPGQPCWIVVGGENGPGARPMHPDWARQIRDQCEAAGVPFWFKGWGTEWMKGWSRSEREQGLRLMRLMGDPGKGDREWNGVPW
jgi:protein gp37